MSKPVIIEPADFVIPKPPTIFEYALGSFTNEGIIDPPAGYPGVQSYAADAAFANDGGVYGGVRISAAGSTITNSGTIKGGVYLNGASFTNAVYATIDGGVSFVGSLFDNHGAINDGLSLTGVLLGTNFASGEINGRVSLIGPASLTNYGGIHGGVALGGGASLYNDGGVVVGATNSVTNGPTSGGGGVYMGANTGDATGAATLNSSGSIAGGSGDLAGGAAVIDFNGKVVFTTPTFPGASQAADSSVTGGASPEGTGGQGLVITGAATLENTTEDTVPITGGNGLYGGTGLLLAYSLDLSADVTVTGGQAYVSADTLQMGAVLFPPGQRNDLPLDGTYGYVGTGGKGAGVDTGATLTNSIIITGGKGADGAAVGMHGGQGGVGIALSGTVDNAGIILGGEGGGGADGSAAGAGGAGALLSGGVLQNDNVVAGGDSAQGSSVDSRGGAGVYLLAPLTGNVTGTVTNSDTGEITGGATTFGQGGVGISLVSGLLTNSGRITGGYSQTGANLDKNPAEGIFAQGGGGVNARGTTIGASYYQAHVNNFGTITGGASGNGYGGIGVYLDGGTQFHNYGVVVGGAGTSGGDGLDVRQTANYTAHNYAGASTTGGAASDGPGGQGAWLDLPGSMLYNGGTITGGASSRGGAGGYGVAVLQGTTLYNYGAITGGSGNDIDSSGLGSEVFEPAAGVLINDGIVDDAGSLTGGTQTLGTTSFTGYGVLFGPQSGGTLILQTYKSDSWQLQGGIGGFDVGDTIDILNMTPAQVINGFNPSTDTLTTPDDGIVTFGGDFSGESFILSAINDGTGTQITLAACYLRGTRILTDQGEVAIESLRIGDHVTTHSGAQRPIRWIGRRSYTGNVAWRDADVLPILIRRGALGEAMPRRDLWVSPEHAMYIDGMLIPAALLVNGVSILREEQPRDVTYFHLEFDHHEVIYAEGAPAESFVDDESRVQFDNVAEYYMLYPHDRPRPVQFCAPRVEEGQELQSVRARLNTVAPRAAQALPSTHISGPAC